MKNLWVKFQPNNAVEVMTDNCTNVYQLIKEVKKELSPLLDSYAPAQLSLSLTDGGEGLRPGLRLTDIPLQPKYLENNDEHPLFITMVVIPGKGKGKGTFLRTLLLTFSITMFIFIYPFTT